MIYFLEFILGSFLLFYGAELLISSAKSISSLFKIPKFVVGMTIIAFGTSLPELFVSMVAMFKNETELVLGNVIGSNITNIGLVLSISVIFKTIYIDFNKVKNDIIFMVLSTAVVTISILTNSLNQYCSLILFLSFAFYVYIMNVSDDELKSDQMSGSLSRNIFLILASILLLGFGTHFFISGATGLALFLGISKLIIGMTIVALGTSLPELVTSLVSIHKKEYDFVIGNIIGSNIFNLILVLAFSLLINSINVVNLNMHVELISLALLTLFLAISIYFSNKINKFNGVLFLLIYIIFIINSYR